LPKSDAREPTRVTRAVAQTVIRLGSTRVVLPHCTELSSNFRWLSLTDTRPSPNQLTRRARCPRLAARWCMQPGSLNKAVICVVLWREQQLLSPRREANGEFILLCHRHYSYESCPTLWLCLYRWRGYIENDEGIRREGVFPASFVLPMLHKPLFAQATGAMRITCSNRHANTLVRRLVAMYTNVCPSNAVLWPYSNESENFGTGPEGVLHDLNHDGLPDVSFSKGDRGQSASSAHLCSCRYTSVGISRVVCVNSCRTCQECKLRLVVTIARCSRSMRVALVVQLSIYQHQQSNISIRFGELLPAHQVRLER
jgi:hypothetical protein